MATTAWCPQCQKPQPVEDEFSTDTGDRYSTVEESWVTALACGHTITTTTGEYPSPLQDDHDLPRAVSLGAPAGRVL